MPIVDSGPTQDSTSGTAPAPVIAPSQQTEQHYIQQNYNNQQTTQQQVVVTQPYTSPTEQQEKSAITQAVQQKQQTFVPTPTQEKSSIVRAIQQQQQQNVIAPVTTTPVQAQQQRQASVFDMVFGYKAEASQDTGYVKGSEQERALQAYLAQHTNSESIKYYNPDTGKVSESIAPGSHAYTKTDSGYWLDTGAGYKAVVDPVVIARLNGKQSLNNSDILSGKERVTLRQNTTSENLAANAIAAYERFNTNVTGSEKSSITKAATTKNAPEERIGMDALLIAVGKDYSTGKDMPVAVVGPHTQYQFGDVSERNPGIPMAKPAQTKEGANVYIHTGAYDTGKQQAVLEAFFSGRSLAELQGMYGADAGVEAYNWSQVHAPGTKGTLGDSRANIEFSKNDLLVSNAIEQGKVTMALGKSMPALMELAKEKSSFQHDTTELKVGGDDSTKAVKPVVINGVTLAPSALDQAINTAKKYLYVAPAGEKPWDIVEVNVGGNKYNIPSIALTTYRASTKAAESIQQHVTNPIGESLPDTWMGKPYVQGALDFASGIPTGLGVLIGGAGIAGSMAVQDHKDAATSIGIVGSAYVAEEMKAFKETPARTGTSLVLTGLTLGDLGVKGVRAGVNVAKKPVMYNSIGETLLAKGHEIKAKKSGYVYQYPEVEGGLRSPKSIDESFFRPSSENMVNKAVKAGKIKPVTGNDVQFTKPLGDAFVDSKSIKIKDPFQYREPTVAEAKALPKINEDEFAIIENARVTEQPLEAPDLGIIVIRDSTKMSRNKFESMIDRNGKFYSGLPVEELVKSTVTRGRPYDLFKTGREVKSERIPFSVLPTVKPQSEMKEPDMPLVSFSVPVSASEIMREQRHTSSINEIISSRNESKSALDNISNTDQKATQKDAQLVSTIMNLGYVQDTSTQQVNDNSQKQSQFTDSRLSFKQDMKFDMNLDYAFEDPLKKRKFGADNSDQQMKKLMKAMNGNFSVLNNPLASAEFMMSNILGVTFADTTAKSKKRRR